MDRLVYTAMSGANALLQRQEVVAHNIANASTPGFRAQMQAFQPVIVPGGGLPTRVQAIDATLGTDFAPGPIQTTGRALDVALDGAGFLAVEGADGREGYTRFGSMEVDANGALRLMTGQAVQGEGGPLTIPQDHALSIGADGTVSAIPLTGKATPVTVGRLKLVNPDTNELERSEDGLFRRRDGADADLDPNAKVTSGALEGSNVNAAEAMVSMIALARQFEMQMKLLQNAEANARSSAQLLNVQG